MSSITKAMIMSADEGGIPTSGLVFYAPFDLNTDDTFGKTMTSMGTVTTGQSEAGISCIKLNNASLLYANSTTDLPDGSSDVTLSIWYKHNSNDFYSPQMFFHLGSQNSGNSFEMGVYQNHWHWNILKNPYEATFGTPDKSWHHLLILKNSTTRTYNNVYRWDCCI